jgi:OmpA-OmpF porin, OOP family
MKRKVSVLSLLLVITILAVSAGAADWTGKTAIGIRGPIWTPYDDHFGPEPFRTGLTGSIFVKQGLSKSIVLDLSGGYAITYNDPTATKDANLKLMKRDLANLKLTNIPLGLTLNCYLMPDNSVQPYLLAGVGVDMWKVNTIKAIGSIPKNTDVKFVDFGFKGGVGVNFWLSENFALDIQGKLTYDAANLSSDKNTFLGDLSKFKNRAFRGYVEPSIGLTYLFGKAKDTDGDGVPDKRDKCPETPLGCIVDKDGCPVDSDGDGVCDGLDKCPDTPTGCKVDITGCPTDSDNDGICDGLDKCPNTPVGCKIDKDGCPLDSDGDGVCDGLDKCPDTPKGCIVDKDGCPLDSDGDGVCDGLDRCPTTPPGTQVDANGCPLNVKPPVKKITLNIKYRTGSFEPDAPSKAILDDLAETMMAYTGTKIEINGYTDDVGSDSSNMVLSRNRANGVMEYLLKKGVPADRMTSQGFGENPGYFVGDNKTAEGRQMNRRVDILSTEN